jgi:hypothetical protein
MLAGHPGPNILLSLTIYFSALGFLLWRGRVLLAGLISLTLSLLPVILDGPEDGGAYGLAFVAMPLAGLSLLFVLIGTLSALGRLFQRFSSKSHG